LEGKSRYDSEPLVMLLALVVSVVADGAKATPFVLRHVIAPTLLSEQSPDIATGVGAFDPQPTRMSPLGRLVQAVVELPLESEPLAVSSWPDTITAPVKVPLPLHVPPLRVEMLAVVGGPAYPEPAPDTAIEEFEEFNIDTPDSPVLSVTVAVAPVPPPLVNVIVHV
jgi:hypothetical protein